MSISISDILTVLSLLVAIGGMIASAVWAVGQIKATASTLGANIKSLGKSLDDLRQVLRSHADRLDDHGQRIARIEGAHEPRRARSSSAD
jgi:septal ring factor EnvC (AmiA/AmiB activator)